VWENVNKWILGDAAADYTVARIEASTWLNPYFAILLLLAVAIVAVLFWQPRLKGVPPAIRRSIIALRAVSILIVMLLLLDPTLVAKRLEPTEHYVAFLFDDSQSMRISGLDGATRGAHLVDAYGKARPQLEDRLKSTHQVASFRFGGHVERLSTIEDLSFSQVESDISGAVQGVIKELEGTTVSAVVLFSDGVQQKTTSATPSLDATVPVFTVGVGTQATWNDLELANLSVSRTSFDKSPVAVTLKTNAAGLAGQRAIAEVLQSSRVVSSKTFTIQEDGQEQQVRLEFVPREREWLNYDARVRLAETGATTRNIAVENIAIAGKDRITENNSRSFLIDNREKTYDILYFSGRPNWENKFARRALEDDKELKMRSLVRISAADRKFVFRGKDSGGTLSNPLFEGFDKEDVTAPRYDEAVFIRMDLADEKELANGYPLTAKELFPYDLVIWGDIEAGFFDRGHLEVTRDFVAKRGGTFLVLGGPRAFSEGGYSNTVIETMLPVVLHSSTRAVSSDASGPYLAMPTVEGFLSGMWSLDNDAEANTYNWQELPPLAGLNRFPMIRSGATVLATAADGESTNPQPLFIWQRYGQGTCAIMATGETWQWRMQGELEDDTHGRYWRQIVRGLLRGVPEAIQTRSQQEAFILDQEARLDVLVRDDLFAEREGLHTTVTVRPPGGQPEELPVEESIAEAGVYAFSFTPEEPGQHLLSIAAREPDGEIVGEIEQALIVHPDHREFQNAQFNADYLRTLSEDTGGKLFSMNQLGEIADSIPWPDSEHSIIRRFHLWHFPLLYFLLAFVLSCEWYLRRRHGQA
jgi:uncharacterized membrane protein